MRESFFEKTWLHDQAGTLTGLVLGYDRCAEHERGMSGIQHALGVAVEGAASGVDGRRATLVPELLEFVDYSHQLSDKRRKAHPAAALVMRSPRYRPVVDTIEGLVDALQMPFPGEPTDPGFTATHNLCCAWGQHGFLITVRGAAEIADLKRLFQAFLDKDIVIGTPTSGGFLRNGLSFSIASKIPEKVRAAVLERELAVS